jgi:cohesin complex subunit SA-1/2
MESSNNNVTNSPAPSSMARRSGRVSKLPKKYTPDASGATKRKRGAEPDNKDVEIGSPGPSDVSSDEEEIDDGSAAEEEIEEQKRRKKSPRLPKARKPAAKKPKINREALAPSGHAARLPSRPKKAARIAVERRDGDGLFGKKTQPLIYAGRVVLTTV